jgi:hypothetical protein
MQEAAQQPPAPSLGAASPGDALAGSPFGPAAPFSTPAASLASSAPHSPSVFGGAASYGSPLSRSSMLLAPPGSPIPSMGGGGGSYFIGAAGAAAARASVMTSLLGVPSYPYGTWGSSAAAGGGAVEGSGSPCASAQQMAAPPPRPSSAFAGSSSSAGMGLSPLRASSYAFVSEFGTKDTPVYVGGSEGGAQTPAHVSGPARRLSDCSPPLTPKSPLFHPAAASRVPQQPGAAHPSSSVRVGGAAGRGH